MKSRHDDDSVFTKPSEPKNTWQLLLWVIFEPLLLEKYSNTLNKKQTIAIFLRTYFWIVLIGLTLYVLSYLIIVLVDTPNLFPEQYEKSFVETYHTLTGFTQKFLFALKNSKSLVAGLATALFYGLTKELALGLVGGMLLVLTGAMTSGLSGGLFLGFSLGLTGGFAFVLIKRLVIGLTAGLATGLAFYLSYFRVYFYPFHFIRSLIVSVDFYRSPYHNDGIIWLPIWGAEAKFRRLALNNAELANKFVGFLRRYRPLQAKLADSIAHVACAGTWLNQPLAFEVLTPPTIENKKLQPTENWLKQLAELRTQLVSYKSQSQLSLKQQHLQAFLTYLDNFTNQTLVENRHWRDEYLQALAQWKKIALEEQQQLTEQTKQQEPITRNVYLPGDALHAGANDTVFFGRDDLKEELERRIYSAQQMPLFLIQGQRRVGKTSLLNFLEPLLGSGFKVVHQDLQDARVSSVQAWLFDLQKRISSKLSLPVPVNDYSDCDWLTAWQRFEDWLETLYLDNSYKLILAFDEYEYLHSLLQEAPKQGGRLLAAMRSFSQRQNHIVFLFVGAALFAELTDPDWGKYFVQAQTFRVDYLPKQDALRLITEPVSLVYPPELPQQMVELTQGHPALLQLLCSEMVNIANKTPKKNMTQADLDEVVQYVINTGNLLPLIVFWQDFCKDPTCKATVRNIIKAQTPSNKKQLNRLREHGFIVQNTNGLWQLRVPLFERWLKAFDRFELD